MDDPLLAVIVEEIQAHPEKRISFRRYMEQALYHPRWGYYRREGLKIGKRGDFYTSPHLGDVFGETMGGVISGMVSSFSPGCPWTLVEAGGGDGRLAGSILSSLEEGKRLPQSLWLVETSPFHRELQSERLRDAPVPVHWAEAVTEIPSDSPCILFSNELLDAFPVHRVTRKEGELLEIHVAWDEDRERLVECSRPLSHPSLAAYFRRLDWDLPEGWTAEVPLDALAWLEEVGEWLRNGYLITIDYGGTTEELSLPQRKDGTLRCYRNHQLHVDCYSHPGDSDLTSHVHFSALMDLGEVMGLQSLVYTTQTRFLQAAGILDRLAVAPADPFSPEARRNRAIRQLALAGGMGDSFRVLIQSKGVEVPVTGLKEELS
ncbi:class I SAM-dependent methyltransferase [Kroppenstedtia eburnea]|uniref:class I SAM-dependent methyltransferase n=1 Tax=Kroppenstedtia eburnea TaxID=714067 RepID=UPI00362EB57B